MFDGISGGLDKVVLMDSGFWLVVSGQF